MSITTKQDYQGNNRQSLLEKILFPVRRLSDSRLQKSIADKTILITGASYGIGAALSTMLGKYNTTLLLVARTEERLIKLKEELEGEYCRVKIYPTDLRSEQEINNLLQTFHKENIQVDIFINNAGKSIYRKLWQSIDRFHDTQRCAATNYTGPVQLVLGLLNGLVSAKAQIINISAVNVLLPPAVGWSAYQSSKAAFDQWLRSVEAELTLKQLSVSHLYLPLVRTNMSMVNENKQKQAAMSKAKAARLVANFIIHKKRKYTPWWLGAVIFIASFLPTLFYRIQLRQLKKKADK
jgi:short-subunit dehydrogenase